MASAAVMAPAMPTSHLDNRIVGADKCVRVCARHCRCRQRWSERKSTGCKSDQHKSLHQVFLLGARYRVIGNARITPIVPKDGRINSPRKSRQVAGYIDDPSQTPWGRKTRLVAIGAFF